MALKRRESFSLLVCILLLFPLTLIHSSFHSWAGLCHRTQWIFHEKLQPSEYPSTLSSEITPTSYSAWYLCLTFRHIPLSKSARSKCHPFSFINSLSELAQVTGFSAAAEQYRSTGRFHIERAFLLQRDTTTLRNMIPWVCSLRSLCWAWKWSCGKLRDCFKLKITVLVSGSTKGKKKNNSFMELQVY